MTDFIDRTKVAKIMRRDLKVRFPQAKFSIRCRSYSGGGSINVSWTDGPTQKDVQAVVSKYESNGFDGMIDMQYHYDHWLLPDGTIELAGTSGTEGSRGTVEGWQSDKPHPDAVKVYLSTGYLFCTRQTSDSFRHGVRQAWAHLSEDERSALWYKINPDRCLSPYERPDSYYLNDTLSDFGDNAERLFDRMADQIAA